MHTIRKFYREKSAITLENLAIFPYFFHVFQGSWYTIGQ